MTPGRRKITWAAVADGGKALIMVNDGTDTEPVLTVLRKDELENPPTREQGSERAGRLRGAGAGPLSAVETTDWHELGEVQFLREFAGRLNRAAERGLFERLILVAPPKVLGELRAALSPAASGYVAAEIGSDLTKHPVDAIESHIAKALAT